MKQAKIIVYEDNEQDLITRYSCLTERPDRYDVHIRHPLKPIMPTSAQAGEWNPKKFSKHGFNPDNFQEGYWLREGETADVYFLDGLGGYCFTLLEEGLPRDRTFIYSGDDNIIDQARREGYNVVDDSVDKIVATILLKDLFTVDQKDLRRTMREIEAKNRRRLTHISRKLKKI